MTGCSNSVHDSRMKKVLACLACVTLFGACSNEVVIEPENDNGAGGSGGASSAMSSGSTGGGSTCVPTDPSTMVEWTCKDLEGLVLTGPVISGDDDGDGYLEPGESATLRITMKDISGLGFNYYPGVNFESSNPKVTTTAESWFYAILPCTEQEATTTIKVLPDVPSGTNVNIRAQVGMLNQECPDAFAVDILVPIY